MNSKKTTCFIDFDHTIFNTDEFFHIDVRNYFLRFGIDRDSWEKSYSAIWHTGYTLEKQAEEICRESGRKIPLAEMKEILNKSFSDLRRYLFPDVMSFLEEASNKKIDLFLLSFGDPGWQEYKVRGSGIDRYFKDIFFTTVDGGKAKTVLEHTNGFDKVIVIDNNTFELDLIKDAIPSAETHRMNRVPTDFVSPRDEISRLKFLEARRYLEKKQRHQHLPCNSLTGIL